MAPTRAHRLKTFDYVGIYRYSLTLCTHRRRCFFVDSGVVQSVLSQFLRAAAAAQFEVFAYCFMPDHVHLLVSGTSNISDVRRFVSLAKQLSGYGFKQARREPLWQKSSWDHVLRSEDDMFAAARYVLANPVRAGLVSAPLDYPFSGSAVHTRHELLDVFLKQGPTG